MIIKNLLEKKLQDIITKNFGAADNINVFLEKPANTDFGDFASNIAMQLAKPLKKNPRQLAQEIATMLQQDAAELVHKVEVAGPGFINISIGTQSFEIILNHILQNKEKYGHSQKFAQKRVLVEFVSANPTGPLHIGHGRGAVVGDTLANLYKAAGYRVEKEYYVNDGGVQIETLGRSLLFRELQKANPALILPENCYQGDYIQDLANSPTAQKIFQQEFKQDFSDAIQNLAAIRKLGEFAGNAILEDIKKDLAETGVVFDNFFFESSLYQSGAVEKTLEKLKNTQVAFEQDGALWIRSTNFGDDKDRVLIKSDKSYTYLTPDIAYHQEKYNRGYDVIVNIWGADHAGYIQRVRAAVKSLGYDDSKLHVNFIQMVNLIKNGEMVSMSTRRATYETLEDVRAKVGKDVVRYFFLMRSHNAQLDFDMELATKQSQDNPVFYVQYAHARICAIFRKAYEEHKITPQNHITFTDVQSLILPEEKQIIGLLENYPSVILHAAEEREPHRVTFYVMDLVKAFQHYYSQAKNNNHYKIISENEVTTRARLVLLKSIQQVLQNAFAILGISAPEKM